MPGFDLNLGTQENTTPTSAAPTMATYTPIQPNILDKIVSLGDGRIILSADDNPVVATANLAPLSLAGTPLIDLPDPTVLSGAANKNYVDASRITYLIPARLLLTTNVSLTVVNSVQYQFLQSIQIDGQTVVQGNRLLFIGQSDLTLNGVWTCNEVTGGFVRIIRPTDFAQGSAIRAGLRISITAGTVNSNKMLENTTGSLGSSGNLIVNYVGTALQTWTTVGTLATTTLTPDANGTAYCTGNFYVRGPTAYNYVRGTGGNSEWFIGGSYNAPGWNGVNIGSQGDGCAWGYHVLPDKSKLSDYAAHRFFVSYNYAAVQFSAANGSTLPTGTTGNNIMYFEGPQNRTLSQNFHPIEDNQYALGTTNNRWTQVCAFNATIQTSDAREKRDVQYIQPQEALEIVNKLHPCWYKWVENSHDRKHSGFLAQDVEQDLGAQEASDWGFFIHSPAFTEIKEVGPEEKAIEIEHGDKYGLRYEELASPLVGAVQCLAQRVSNLEQLSMPPVPPVLQRQTACDVSTQPTDANAEVAALQAKVSTLEARLADMEAWCATVSSIFKK